MSTRFDQCDEPADCGHCKGHPVAALRAEVERLQAHLAVMRSAGVTAFAARDRAEAEVRRLKTLGVPSILAVEVSRQDAIHPDGYPPTRDGIRLALAAAADELAETLDAWRAARCKCPAPRCGHHDWAEVRVEAVQTAAVLMRMVREL
jgi:hypothetical protein